MTAAEQSMDLEQLTAYEEIRLVKARYCRFIDTQQWESFARLFARDVSLTFYDVGGTVLYSFNDFEQFLTSTIEALSNAHSIHQVHNSEIELTSTSSASAIWSMEDRISYTEGAPRSFRSLHGFGHYYETLQFTDGKWLIKSLELKRTFLNVE
jgi:hypothetical protein